MATMQTVLGHWIQGREARQGRELALAAGCRDQDRPGLPHGDVSGAPRCSESIPTQASRTMNPVLDLRGGRSRAPPDALHPQRRVRPRPQAAARARARRGPVRLRHPRQPLLRRALGAVLLAARLLLRRGARRGGRGADGEAAVRHDVELGPSGRGASSPSGWPSWRRPGSGTCSSRAAAPSRSSRRGSSPACTTSPPAASSARRRSRDGSPTTAPRLGALALTGVDSYKAPFGPPGDPRAARRRRPTASAWPRTRASGMRCTTTRRSRSAAARRDRSRWCSRRDPTRSRSSSPSRCRTRAAASSRRTGYWAGAARARRPLRLPADRG